MEISDGYCPDCWFCKVDGTFTSGRGEYKTTTNHGKHVNMILNEQGYYECPECHLQTVWVDKEYPHLWILKERGVGKFRDATHPE